MRVSASQRWTDSSRLPLSSRPSLSAILKAARADAGETSRPMGATARTGLPSDATRTVSSGPSSRAQWSGRGGPGTLDVVGGCMALEHRSALMGPQARAAVGQPSAFGLRAALGVRGQVTVRATSYPRRCPHGA